LVLLLLLLVVLLLTVCGPDLRAALVASCFRGALPPVDLRAVCFVRAAIVLRVLSRVLKWQLTN